MNPNQQFLEVPAVHFQGYLPRIVGWWSSKDLGLNTFEQLSVGFFGEVVGISTGLSDLQIERIKLAHLKETGMLSVSSPTMAPWIN